MSCVYELHAPWIHQGTPTSPVCIVCPFVLHAIQVQAAMEGAASAANSRSTSHAPSRAHSPDLFAGRQEHADSSGSRAHSPAGSDVADDEPYAEAEQSSNNLEQAGSREAHSPDSRASDVHSSLNHSPDSGQHELQRDAMSEQMLAHTHGRHQSRDLSGSQPSSIQTNLAASKEGVEVTGTAAAAQSQTISLMPVTALMPEAETKTQKW